jgi:poly(3-hydroxybutyrate) depolymerase
MNHSTRTCFLAALPLLTVTLGGCLSAASSTATDAGTDHDAGHVTPTPDGGTVPDATVFTDAKPPKGDADSGQPKVEAGPADTGLIPEAAGDAGDVIPPWDGDATSRCIMNASSVVCTQQTYTITTPAGSDHEAGTTFPSYQRIVHYQVPLGTAPAAGWPTVFMFQGSFLSAGLSFSATSSEDFGMYYQTELIKYLLDAGYAVLAPEALAGGETYWQTNISPYYDAWEGSPDDLLIEAMFADVASGVFGPLDSSTLYATGISSGGYMTSRMAISYVGKFKALAIESGAYATCLSGDLAETGQPCTVPALSATHPPTLFLHGDTDTIIVPINTVQIYEAALKKAGVTYNEVDDPSAGHQWIPEAPAAVLAWFQAYP